jgi:hypothetical protein
VNETTVDTRAQYSFWERRLKGEILPIHDSDPQSGFYRLIRKDGTSHPVAYWFDKAGALRCRIGDADVDEQRAMEAWPWASKHPIAYATYQAVRRGESWPDEHPAVILSNNAPADDSFEGLSQQIESFAEAAEAMIKAGAAPDQSTADQASHLANKLSDLQKKADAARAAEKKPHDDKAAEVQAKWKPVIGVADIYRRLKAAVVEPFLKAEDKKRREAEDAARKAAEEAARTGQPIPEPVPAATRSAPKAGAGGRRSVALRTVKVVTISDRAALLAFFADNQRVTDLLQDMAEKAVRAGVTVPGVTVTEEQRAA